MSLYFSQVADDVDYTPGSAVTAGDPVRLPDGSIGVVNRTVASGVPTTVRKGGIFRGDANSGDTWSKGETLIYDASTGKLVKAALTLDGSADMVIGPAAVAKTSGQLEGFVELEGGPRNRGLVTQAVVFEFDHADADAHVLIPASQNPFGLMLLGCYGIVTEQMAGSSQDQMIVTVEDTDGTDLCTLTASDSAADAVGDVIVGTADIFSATTGDAAKFVPAGKGVQGIVSQATAGTPAGKIKVYALFLPIL